MHYACQELPSASPSPPPKGARCEPSDHGTKSHIKKKTTAGLTAWPAAGSTGEDQLAFEGVAIAVGAVPVPVAVTLAVALMDARTVVLALSLVFSLAPALAVAAFLENAASEQHRNNNRAENRFFFFVT